jgi:hypothetical protein
MIESLDERRLRTLAPHVVAQRERKPPNGLAFSCGERAAQDDFKKARILRAKRSTATPCSATSFDGVKVEK